MHKVSELPKGVLDTSVLRANGTANTNVLAHHANGNALAPSAKRASGIEEDVQNPAVKKIRKDRSNDHDNDNHRREEPETTSNPKRMRTHEENPAPPSTSRENDAELQKNLVDLKIQLLQTVKKFRESERLFWQHHRQLEESAKNMATLCSEVEVLAAKLDMKNLVKNKHPASHVSALPSRSPAAKINERKSSAVEDNDDDVREVEQESQPTKAKKRQAFDLASEENEDSKEKVAQQLASAKKQSQPSDPVSSSLLAKATPSKPPGVKELLLRPVKTFRGPVVPVLIKHSRDYSSILSPTPVIIKPSFPRKPRSLVLHPLAAQPATDIVATSSLDGSVQFWSYANRSQLAQLSQAKLQGKWTEDMCFVGGGAALALGQAQLDQSNPQVTLACFQVNSSLDDFGYRVRHLSSKPHSFSDLSCISPVNDSQDSYNFVTGGKDKRIFFWRVHADYDYEKIDEISTKHTSACQSIQCSSDWTTLYSGGADKKFFATDLTTQSQKGMFLCSDRVAFVGVNPVDPNIIMLSLSNKKAQIALLDTRTFKMIDNFGWEEKDNLSQYIHPTWHPAGHLIACGTSGHLLNIWDVRYNLLSTPTQSLHLHEDKILRAAFHPRDKSILSISTDNNMRFTTFRLS